MHPHLACNTTRFFARLVSLCTAVAFDYHVTHPGQRPACPVTASLLHAVQPKSPAFRLPNAQTSPHKKGNSGFPVKTTMAELHKPAPEFPRTESPEPKAGRLSPYEQEAEPRLRTSLGSSFGKGGGFRSTSPVEKPAPFRRTRTNPKTFDEGIYKDSRGIPQPEPSRAASPEGSVAGFTPSSPGKKGANPHGAFDNYPDYKESPYKHPAQVEGILRHPKVHKPLHKKAFCSSTNSSRSTLPTRSIIFAKKTF